MRMRTIVGVFIAVLGAWGATQPAFPQQRDSRDQIVSVRVTPESLTLEVGEKASLTATAVDAEGDGVESELVFLSRARRSVSVSSDGEVEAYRPGEYTIIVLVPGPDPAGGRRDGAVRAEVPVTIPLPGLERVELNGVPSTLYTGVYIRGRIELFDASGALRQDPVPSVASSNPAVVSIDRFGNVTAKAPGIATLEIHAGGIETEVPVRVLSNPAVSVELTPETESARTGDVIRFHATPRDGQGNVVEDLPVFYSIQSQPDASIRAAPAAGQVSADGRFVAELPGRYTIAVNAGGLFAAATVEINPRNVQRRIRIVGRAPVRDRHTSDLWVWEGIDGRDYALTGTWRAEGHAYLWDVTDPSNITMTDSVQVDARTVNDVKVSENGRVAVLSREGAANRRNGIIILDVSNPTDVEQLSEFDSELTGGVHNTFVHQDHVYAVNNGRRYDVIDISDPTAPFRVSSFELETPGHSIHDVWVDDGIAYSSNWRDGVVLADVGNGMAGGSPERPIQFAAYAGPDAQTHAAYPFRSASTGKFYVILGDEIFPTGMDPGGPNRAAGYMHIVDFTDFENPVEVARYEVPEAGSHNLWVQDDVLYAAFYNGGLRVVDLSGELMGDLYRQGREMAAFSSNDFEGFVTNEAMVWGVQVHKGLIYFSDFNSGLWVARLIDTSRQREGGRIRQD